MAEANAVRLSKIAEKPEGFEVIISGLINKSMSASVLDTIKRIVYKSNIVHNFHTNRDFYIFTVYSKEDKHNLAKILNEDPRTSNIQLSYDRSDVPKYRFLITGINIDNCKFGFDDKNANVKNDYSDPRVVSNAIEFCIRKTIPGASVSMYFGDKVIINVTDREVEEMLFNNPFHRIENSFCTIYRYPSVKFCKKCLVVGHVEDDCTSSVIRCWKCLSVGHLHTGCDVKAKPDCPLCTNDAKYGKFVKHRPAVRECGYIIYHLMNDPSVIYPSEVVQENDTSLLN